jgi:hypothetical protein
MRGSKTGINLERGREYASAMLKALKAAAIRGDCYGMFYLAISIDFLSYSSIAGNSTCGQYTQPTWEGARWIVTVITRHHTRAILSWCRLARFGYGERTCGVKEHVNPRAYYELYAPGGLSEREIKACHGVQTASEQWQRR